MLQTLKLVATLKKQFFVSSSSHLLVVSSALAFAPEVAKTVDVEKLTVE
jgi:hypothetical protein